MGVHGIAAFTTVRGIWMHVSAYIKGFFKGLFSSNKSIAQAIREEDRKLYNVTPGTPFKKLNIEGQAYAVQNNYTAGEKIKSGKALTNEEIQAQKTMKGAVDFPK